MSAKEWCDECMMFHGRHETRIISEDISLIQSQAKRIEEQEAEYAIELDRTLRKIESLQTENAELKERLQQYRVVAQAQIAEVERLEKENATLLATAELAWLSLRDYTTAQSRMSDEWGRVSESAKRQLWKDLHFCEAGGREAMNAIKANAAHPANNPTDSDGSGT